MGIWHRRTTAAERAAEKELEELREWRRNRFRILVCIDGTDASYEGLRFAKEIGQGDECDIILLYVRPIDQGLRSGGLQIRVARENMLEWGLELPGVQYLKKGLALLTEEKAMAEQWSAKHTHTNLRGDPLGDNKVEYRHESGKSIVLKLKTAPDAASGILDQYELGPYNVMILGAPSRWQGELRSFWDAGVAQKVAMLSPCSVLITREQRDGKGFLICTNGTEHSMDALRRAAVLAHLTRNPITLVSVALDKAERGMAEQQVSEAKAMLAEDGIKVAEALTRVGDPVAEIKKLSKDYALTVVSDSGKSRLKRFIRGSVAFGVMGQARNSVLNVR
ncbi:MAG: universal stress protein [Alphaproteobacteria bacterium]|nr:universal stress protein [Alphaproteobacteria bacterium]